MKHNMNIFYVTRFICGRAVSHIAGETYFPSTSVMLSMMDKVGLCLKAAQG